MATLDGTRPIMKRGSHVERGVERLDDAEEADHRASRWRGATRASVSDPAKLDRFLPKSIPSMTILIDPLPPLESHYRHPAGPRGGGSYPITVGKNDLSL